ncbi:MAG: hypothetical protein R3F30_06455 [Planctomycetota bacterium]
MRRSLALALVLSTQVAPSCATVPAVAVSPVSGLVDLTLNSSIPAYKALWLVPLATVYTIVVSPFFSLVNGIEADMGCLQNGEYGADRGIGYWDVFTPISTFIKHHTH